MSITRPRARHAFILFLAMFVAAPVRAQVPQLAAPRPPSGGSRGAALAINVGVGAATAGISRLLDRRPVKRVPLWRSVVAGSAAGATIFAGKVIVAESCDGCGLVGRQVAAVGGSVLTNATIGRTELEELVLPLGPFRVHVRGRGGAEPVPGERTSPVWVKVDLPTAVTAAWLASSGDRRLDLGASLSAGAPVFVAPGGENVAEQLFGVILVNELRGLRWNGKVDRITLGHESVHVLQYDQRSAMWSAPVEHWVARRSTVAGRVLRYVELGITEPVWQMFAFDAPYDRRITEREAWLLAGPAPRTAGTLR